MATTTLGRASDSSPQHTNRHAPTDAAQTHAHLTERGLLHGQAANQAAGDASTHRVHHRQVGGVGPLQDDACEGVWCRCGAGWAAAAATRSWNAPSAAWRASVLDSSPQQHSC
jgi:hypothetical protein